ncbi:endolytic transglycosylase MltG [Rhodobacteraceae bacterium CCMM004]|nr:endolytic transglycosylase MltG [Rhodobacteraceae bacterium CCMM004]
MWTHIASNALTLLIAVLVVAGGVVAWGQLQYTQPGPLSQAICLRVESGSNMRRVSEELDERGAITSPEIFRISAEYGDRTGSLKAGSFLIEEGASMEEIVEVVTVGGQSTCGTEVVYRIGVTSQELQVRELDPSTNRFMEVAAFDPAEEEAPEPYLSVREESDTRYRVALAEGATSWQIVEALKQADFLEGDVPEVPAEGSLAPDSYEVRAGASRGDLLDRMSTAQTARLAAVWDARDPDLPIDTPEEALILASLIEKETGVAEERETVASVFVNRLRQGMRLQTDPTVIYGITKGQGTLGRGLRRSELDRETPYNTYRIDGLPPTPIANPGLASLEAAVNPGESDYLYFVADGTGGHTFSRTLAEHNEAVARWRAIEAERASQ